MESGDVFDFDPTELVKNREGTFVIPKSVETYLSKHTRQCLTKEEGKALFKEHPRPDTEVCTVPKVDRYMAEYHRCLEKINWERVEAMLIALSNADKRSELTGLDVRFKSYLREGAKFVHVIPGQEAQVH